MLTTLSFLLSLAIADIPVTHCRWQKCTYNHGDNCVEIPYQCGNWEEGDLTGKQQGNLVRTNPVLKLECMPKKLWQKKGWTKSD